MRTELRKRFAFGSLVALMVCALSLITSSQDTLDSVLRPPKGSQVAIVVFEDLECPMCRRTAPLVEQASKTYKIPVIRHDFPLPMDPWSYQAAVMARYFDTFSKSMGNDFRDYIFENQLEVNIQNLKSFADKFAAVHKVFGASNVAKLLLHIPAPRRSDAVLTISYEAQARLSDPVYGCVATIFALQQQVRS